jgi:hypothetical protein
MRLPLDHVLRRGVVFLWTKYDKLDDPTLSSQVKPKFVVFISASVLDDPLFYLLTTSAKSKHAHSPFANDLFRIAAGSYAFFPQETLIDVGVAGELEIGRAEFEGLYEADEVVYKGVLTDVDVAALVEMILASRRVSTRFKRVING